MRQVKIYAYNSHEMTILFSLEKKKGKLEFLYATVLLGALRVKYCR